MEGGFAVPAAGVGVGAGLDQGLKNGGMAAAGGEQKRGFAVVAGGVWVGFGGEQGADSGEVAIGGGAQQGRRIGGEGEGGGEKEDDWDSHGSLVVITY